MVTSCGCMCRFAGHYGACQITATPRRTHLVGGLTVVPGAEVCEPCFDAVAESVRHGRSRAGRSAERNASLLLGATGETVRA